MTRQLMQAAHILQIDFLDHVILTRDAYTSLSDEGCMGPLC